MAHIMVNVKFFVTVNEHVQSLQVNFLHLLQLEEHVIGFSHFAVAIEICFVHPSCRVAGAGTREVNQFRSLGIHNCGQPEPKFRRNFKRARGGICSCLHDLFDDAFANHVTNVEINEFSQNTCDEHSAHQHVKQHEDLSSIGLSCNVTIPSHIKSAYETQLER